MIYSEYIIKSIPRRLLLGSGDTDIDVRRALIHVLAHVALIYMRLAILAFGDKPLE
jgi:hypothetical protein